MSGIVAHVAGVPVEETLLAFAPALLVGGAVALPTARAALERWRAPLRRRPKSAALAARRRIRSHSR